MAHNKIQQPLLQSPSVSNHKTDILEKSFKANNQTMHFSKSTTNVQLAHNKIAMTKFWIVTIAIGVIIGLVALTAFAVSIYGAVRTIKETTSGTSNVTTTLGMRWNPLGTTVAGIGSTGYALSSRLYNPFKIFIDASKFIYIADQSYHRIQRWSVGDGKGTTVAGQPNGVLGNTSSDFNNPMGIYVDSNSNLYVADTNNHRIQLWQNGSLSGTTIAGTGISGNASNQLFNPRDVTMYQSSGTLYIADTDNHRIMQYVVNATNGTIVAGGRGAGTFTYQLYNPYAVYFDSSTNSLVIANSGAHIIVRWVIGASGWTLLAGNIGSSGNSQMMFDYPSGVTLDSFGNMYVADTYNSRIQFFPSGQQNGTTIAGVLDTNGYLASQLYYPRSIALDSQLNLYVSDSSNHRVQMFTRY